MSRVPNGTIVGINASQYVLHPKAFGGKVDQCISEKQLQRPGEDTDLFEERTKKAKRADMTFSIRIENLSRQGRRFGRDK
ncbi:uncharacterized protein Z518_05602 [Rhinocladiella mackenziei CBS 650.93]|uniref:Rhinocladiella mackenziei CBS 650.93 unplaced genomic scaffold supercont1.4, whole genome shotgun sequence n=1 Tax=Rhinocladiella mackenziei CBS 650.93 TaxID=1442369 RepID=A0A0D2FRA3_9EURO|nr:uncharacterized protein Z518_05602 [Rhinocladiella mackenziei CBS 650.93]KIX04732.1 hypothetical protein Z518_05602 [Rhinocladiella mackenziei CBS 650.93]